MNILDSINERIVLTVASVVSVVGLATYAALTIGSYFQALTSAMSVVR